MDPETRHASPPQWRVNLDFLREIDRALLGRLGLKMVYHLVLNGLVEAERLFERDPAWKRGGPEDRVDDNRPLPGAAMALGFAEKAFDLAAEHLEADEILALLQSWLKEDKTTFLKTAVERFGLPLSEVADALQRFQHGNVEERELSPATRTGLRAGLARRFLTEQLEFVNTAKKYLEIGDFDEIAQHIVYSGHSFGRLGGKTAGLFLASKVVARSGVEGLAGELRIPKSWFIPSDGLFDFLYHNDLGEVINRKYDDPERVRLEYPLLVLLFKSSLFPRKCCATSLPCSTIWRAGRSSCAAPVSSKTGSAPPSRASTKAFSSPTPAARSSEWPL